MLKNSRHFFCVLDFLTLAILTHRVNFNIGNFPSRSILLIICQAFLADYENIGQFSHNRRFCLHKLLDRFLAFAYYYV